MFQQLCIRHRSRQVVIIQKWCFRDRVGLYLCANDCRLAGFRRRFWELPTKGPRRGCECNRDFATNDHSPIGRGRNTLFSMVPKHRVGVALVIIAVVLEYLAFASLLRADDSSDEPLKKTEVDLGQYSYLKPSPRNHILLSCFYYPAVMVKQLHDPGVKGVLWVTITPISNARTPECRRSHGSTERFIARGWWGFIGIKGQILMLEAADGEDGGMAVRFLNLKTGRRVFEDSIALGDFRIDFAQTQDGRMSMRYLRVVRGDCSIPKGRETCWNKFRQQFGLLLASVPTCTGYEGEQPVPAEEEQTPSAITYPVEVELFPRPVIRAVPGPVKCMPQQ